MTITVDYSHKNFAHEAKTLNPCDLGHNEESGWTIEGHVHEDYYEWINEFVATHSDYGIIKGNFEDEVTAESQEALDHFLKHHHYNVWDYYDI